MNDYRHMHIIAEGPTEDSFLKSVVLPYLNEKNPITRHCAVTNFNNVT